MKKKLYNFTIKAIATGFGSGYSPIAPGTAGAFVGVILFLALIKLNLSPIFWVVFILFLFAAGVLTSTLAEKLFGKKDPHPIVIDEIAGCFFLLFIPLAKWYIIVAFIIYRILDILKPFPAYRSQKLPGGWGIMVDDIIVGVYTVVIIKGFIWLKEIFAA